MLNALARQNIYELVERMPVIIRTLAGGVLSHMKFFGFSRRDEHLPVRTESFECSLVKAHRNYFVRLFKLLGNHVPYGLLRERGVIILALVAVEKSGESAVRHRITPCLRFVYSTYKNSAMVARNTSP